MMRPNVPDVARTVILLMLLQGLPGTYCACPERCRCEHNGQEVHITCSNVNTFPTNLPLNTTSLKLQHGTIQEIPPWSVSNVAFLKTIELRHLRINKIKGAAFINITNQIEKTIRIIDCIIENIESRAFDNLRYIYLFNIHKTKLSSLASYAFSSLNDVRNFEITACNIVTISPLAFYSLQNIDTFEIWSSNIENIGSHFITAQTMNSFKIEMTFILFLDERAFASLMKVNIFTMQNCEVSTITPAQVVLADTTDIHTANIVGCTFPLLSLDFFPTNVKLFRISSNTFDSIFCKSLKITASLSSAIFNSNIIACDCRLHWMLKYISGIAAGFICHDGRQLKDHTVSTLSCDGVEPVTECMMSYPTTTSGPEMSTSDLRKKTPSRGNVLETGIIIAICVLGAVVVIGVVIAVTICMLKKRRKTVLTMIEEDGGTNEKYIRKDRPSLIDERFSIPSTVESYLEAQGLESDDMDPPTPPSGECHENDSLSTSDGPPSGVKEPDLTTASNSGTETTDISEPPSNNGLCPQQSQQSNHDYINLGESQNEQA